MSAKWKRNAVVATMLVLVCAAVGLNWKYAGDEAVEQTGTKILGEATLVSGQETAPSEEAVYTGSDYFASARLTRQQAREEAVELLQETMVYEEGEDGAAEASNTLDHLSSDALAESQIESLVIAKGYADCVAYIHNEGISVAVSAPQDGLSQTDVALISDVVTSQTTRPLSDLRIIEVK